MTPEQRIDKILTEIQDEKFQFQLAEIALGYFKQRVFKEGKDVNGKKVGTYSSKSYRIRRRKGQKATIKKLKNGNEIVLRPRPKRQANYVDFQFYGDLKNSLVPSAEFGLFIVRSKGTFVSNGKTYNHLQKGKWYEDKNAVDVFSYGEFEKEKVAEQIERRIKYLIKNG